MDKLAEAFKGIVALFHGIVATWLFLEFSDRDADEFHFVILLVFFSVADVVVWRAIVSLCGRAFKGAREVNTTIAFDGRPYRLSDVMGLTAVAIGLGLLAAYVDRRDVVLTLANHVTNWHRTASGTPLDRTMEAVAFNNPADFDKRASDQIRASRQQGTYLRLNVKDAKFGYEGYPGVVSTRNDKTGRGLVLTPACRFRVDGNDIAPAKTMQRIEGPGVFLQLNAITAIEIIDARQSACSNLPGG